MMAGEGKATRVGKARALEQIQQQGEPAALPVDPAMSCWGSKGRLPCCEWPRVAHWAGTLSRPFMLGIGLFSALRQICSLISRWLQGERVPPPLWCVALLRKPAVFLAGWLSGLQMERARAWRGGAVGPGVPAVVAGIGSGTHRRGLKDPGASGWMRLTLRTQNYRPV